MAQLTSWPVGIAPVGPVAMGTTLWRKGGQLRVTVVAKATLAFVPNGTMTLVEPSELRRVEEHYGDNPVRSIRSSGDLSPFLEAVDVLFVGHAYAPGGVPAPGVTVRLAVARSSILLDKILEVHGDRGASPGQASEPKPFQKMPIVYERAYGGIGASENPLGIAVPNILYADPARRSEAAGFGAISWYWPLRKRLLRGHSRQTLEQGVAEIPDDFDAGYFQAAPLDQRIPSLQGDELIMLQGLHPVHPSLTMRLPGARAMARVYTGGGMGRPFALTLDTLFIDGDAERASITWRGSFPVSGEESLAGLSVAAGIELPGMTIEWPDLAQQQRAAASAAAAHAQSAAGGAVDGTVLMVDNPRPAHSAMPFQAAAPGPARNPMPPPRRSVPPPPPSKPIALSNSPFEGTVALEPEEDDVTIPKQVPRPSPSAGAASAASALRPSRPPPPAPSSPGSSEESAFEGTVMLLDQKAAAARPIAAPFQIPATSAPRPAASAPIPGAPWSGSRAPEVPRHESPYESTASAVIPGREALSLQGKAEVNAEAEKEPEPSKAPAVKPEPAPPKPAETPADKPEKPAWSWATPAPDPTATNTSAPTPPPKRPPAPAVKSKLYGKFVPPKK